MKIALPTFQPGGMDSKVNPHFGKCDCVTIVTMDNDNKITETSIVKPEGQHSCSTIPTLFEKNGADSCIVGGIGGRPFMILQQSGIRVYAIKADMIEKPVKELISEYYSGNIPELGNSTCSK